jgi:hypothetical protein
MKNEADTFIRNVGNHLPGDTVLQTTQTKLSITHLLKSQNSFNLILVHEVRATDHQVQKPLNTKINARVCIKVPVIPQSKHSVVPLEGPIRECCILEITVMCCVDHSELCGEKY